MKKLLIQHLIHDNNHHYKLSIYAHWVGVVLLERKELKKSGVYSLQKNNVREGFMKRTFIKKLCKQKP